MLIVRIGAYELIVEIQSDANYPDHLQDIANRAAEVFKESVETMQRAQIPLVGADELPDEETEL
jgi:capsular polysaccharide biosynthesis protein